MIKLKNILNEILITEISENTTLYHRSRLQMNPGDTIKPYISAEKSSHWLEEKKSEQALEEIRKKEFPDKPSRFKCIFSSLIPRSRFVDKGCLYAIKPIGRIHITDSKFIDEYSERFNREWYDRYYNDANQKYYDEHRDRLAYIGDYSLGNLYWKGVTPNRENIKRIEVLSDSAIVLEKIEESEKTTPMKVDDDVIVTESGKIRARLDLYFNSDSHPNKEHYTMNEIKEIIKYIKDNYFDSIEKENDIHSIRDREIDTTLYYDITGMLKKDAKLKIIHLESSGTRDVVKGKYYSMMFDFYYDGELISRDITKNRKNIHHRFETAYYAYNEDTVRNFAKYLKKI